MDVKDKKTVLDDSAQIYQERKEKTEREKWHELKGFSEKWAYFKSYYLLKVSIVCIVAVLLVYMGITIFSPKPEQLFYAAIVDYVVPEESVAKMQEEFADRLEVTQGEEEICFDTEFPFTFDYDYSSRQKFMTYAFAGQIDVVLMPQSTFLDYAAYFVPLSEHLPSDLYMALSDRLLYAVRRDESGNVIEGSEQIYGIDVSGVPLLEGSTCEEPVVLAIVGNSSHKETSVEFIRYLFGK